MYTETHLTVPSEAGIDGDLEVLINRLKDYIFAKLL